MITVDEIVSALHNSLLYEQNLVSYINKEGEQVPLNNFSGLYEKEDKTIKIEGMERFCSDIFNRAQYYSKRHAHHGPVTCHAFIAQKNSPSFPLHTDPDNVIIYCLTGRKTLNINGEYIILEPEQEVLIPAGTPHQAINEDSSIVLSFGLEKYLKDKMKKHELDDLFKNNGNL